MNKYETIFWDFDGVIKDSNKIKGEAYEQIFRRFGEEVAQKAGKHNREHGGISRFEKIPLYLKNYACLEPSDVLVKELLDGYTQITVEGVIASDWVDETITYIRNNVNRKSFYVVTGTSQVDMKVIIERLQIANYFREIYGSPRKKPEIIASVMKAKNLPQASCAMIGDALVDYEAARENEIDFYWVENDISSHLFSEMADLRLRF